MVTVLPSGADRRRAEIVPRRAASVHASGRTARNLAMTGPASAATARDRMAHDPDSAGAAPPPVVATAPSSGTIATDQAVTALDSVATDVRKGRRVTAVPRAFPARRVTATSDDFRVRRWAAVVGPAATRRAGQRARVTAAGDHNPVEIARVSTAAVTGLLTAQAGFVPSSVATNRHRVTTAPGSAGIVQHQAASARVSIAAAIGPDSAAEIDPNRAARHHGRAAVPHRDLPVAARAPTTPSGEAATCRTDSLAVAGAVPRIAPYQNRGM